MSSAWIRSPSSSSPSRCSSCWRARARRRHAPARRDRRPRVSPRDAQARPQRRRPLDAGDRPHRRRERRAPARARARPRPRAGAAAGRHAARAGAAAAYAPVDPEAIGVTRRQFFNRGDRRADRPRPRRASAPPVLAFLWPQPVGGFGGKVNVGKLDDILAAHRRQRGCRSTCPRRRDLHHAVPGRRARRRPRRSYYAPRSSPAWRPGIVALYQKCVHLGCRVPWCQTSQWFECPCHGSKYNRVGEKKGGPAPRGLDRFPVDVTGGKVIDRHRDRHPGPPIGTNTTGQEAEGPHCV